MSVTEPSTRSLARRTLGMVAAAGVVVGGLLVIAGSFLPWTISRNEPLFAVGWQGNDSWMPNEAGTLALVVLLAGLVMVVGGVLTSRHPTWWKGTLLSAVIAGILGWAAFDTAIHTFGMFSHPPGFSFGEHLDVPGSGIWFILAGAVIGGVASVIRRPWGSARSAGGDDPDID